MGKVLLGVFLSIVLLWMFTLVSGKMTLVTQDDEIYNIYESEIPLEKGWNLVSFGGELKEDSEIQQKDLKAIYYYNPADKKYVRSYPENKEWTNLWSQDTCGDQSCSAKERESYTAWCSQDCQIDLNDDIISNLKGVSTQTFTLKKDQKQNVNFAKYYDIEIYWNKDSPSGSCEDRGYGSIDCVMLHATRVGSGLDDVKEFTNSPQDGNPYNDMFGNSHLIASDNSQGTVIYGKVDYSTNAGEFVITLYEIEDSRLRPGSNQGAVPSLQAYIKTQPAWVYSDKVGVLKMKYDANLIMNEVKLQSGWNFVKITPEFSGKSINQIKGSCNIQKIYGFESENWVEMPSHEWSDSSIFTSDILHGRGLAVKAVSVCTLHDLENLPPIPQ